MATGGSRINSLGSLPRLLRTIFMRPNLAAQVRIIALNLNMGKFEVPLTQDERRMIMDTADRLQISFPQHLFGGNVAWWTAEPVPLPRGWNFVLSSFCDYAL